MNFTATYSPEDNKLRLYASQRLEPELYARVKATGKAVIEVWQASVAAKVNTAKYEAVPVGKYLADLNKAVARGV